MTREKAENPGPGYSQPPPWQVYVYFKVKPEDKQQAIKLCMQLARNLDGYGVYQGLMERMDQDSGNQNLHTLMEIYTPSDCINGINCNGFVESLQRLTSNWGMQLSQPPLRVTEVFVNVKGL